MKNKTFSSKKVHFQVGICCDIYTYMVICMRDMKYFFPKMKIFRFKIEIYSYMTYNMHA